MTYIHQQQGRAAAARREPETYDDRRTAWREMLPPCGRFGLFVFLEDYDAWDGPLAEVEFREGTWDWAVITLDGGVLSVHHEVFDDPTMAMAAAERLVQRYADLLGDPP